MPKQAHGLKLRYISIGCLVEVIYIYIYLSIYLKVRMFCLINKFAVSEKKKKHYKIENDKI